ncbi:MAG: hypothetical protein RR441_12035 [Longicatena sp.]
MFKLGKNKERKVLDINEAYQNYLKNPQKIAILCADELANFDDIHLVGAECFPLRLMDKIEEYYPEKDMKYYVYAIQPLISEKACKKMMKKDYDVYDLGSLSLFTGDEEGILVPKKRRKRKK